MDKLLILVLHPDGRITTEDGKDVVGEFVRNARPLGPDLTEYVQEGLAATFPNHREARTGRPAPTNGR